MTYSQADYHGGIWAVGEQLFRDTQDVVSNNTDLQPRTAAIAAAFGIDWPSVSWEDLRKPLYSAIAARFSLEVALGGSGEIPRADELSLQADFWALNYNAAGSVTTFMAAVEELYSGLRKCHQLFLEY